MRGWIREAGCIASYAAPTHTHTHMYNNVSYYYGISMDLASYICYGMVGHFKGGNCFLLLSKSGVVWMKAIT
jgi:hypothetical protein